MRAAEASTVVAREGYGKKTPNSNEKGCRVMVRRMPPPQHDMVQLFRIPTPVEETVDSLRSRTERRGAGCVRGCCFSTSA